MFTIRTLEQPIHLYGHAILQRVGGWLPYDGLMFECAHKQSINKTI